MLKAFSSSDLVTVSGLRRTAWDCLGLSATLNLSSFKVPATLNPGNRNCYIKIVYILGIIVGNQGIHRGHLPLFPLHPLP